MKQPIIIITISNTGKNEIWFLGWKLLWLLFSTNILIKHSVSLIQSVIQSVILFILVIHPFLSLTFIHFIYLINSFNHFIHLFIPSSIPFLFTHLFIHLFNFVYSMIHSSMIFFFHSLINLYCSADMERIYLTWQIPQSRNYMYQQDQTASPLDLLHSVKFCMNSISQIHKLTLTLPQQNF